MALAELADRASARFKSQKTNAAVAEGRTSPGSPRLVLAKPNSFMNLSGGPVAALLRFYKIDAALFAPAEVWVSNLDSGNTWHAGALNMPLLLDLWLQNA